MLDWNPQPPYTAEQLLQVIRILRDPENGCPWDKVQTHASIRKNFLEETCEALEAIDADDAVLLREELGDVLMQVVFHAAMEEERGRFTFEDVCRNVCEKLVFRHPNIFASSAEENAGINGWDALKNKEKGRTTLAKACRRARPWAAGRSRSAASAGSRRAGLCQGRGSRKAGGRRPAAVCSSERRPACRGGCRGSADLCIQALCTAVSGTGTKRYSGRMTCSDRTREFKTNQMEANNMTKTDLIAQVAANTEMSKKSAEQAVSAVFEALGKAMTEGEKITISGFGTFEVRERAERQGINPRTREPITIAASRSIVFKPGKSLKDTL